MTGGKGRDLKGFYTQAAVAAKVIREYADKGEFIRVVSHLDADGLSAASIMGRSLTQLGASFRIRIWKQLDEELLKELTSEGESPIVFTDLGSGSLDIVKAALSENEVLIIDHHQPMDASFPKLCHVNPHLYGFDGSREISSAGVAYLVSKALDGSNIDLAPLGVVGALGDSQDRAEKRAVTGLNETIVKDAVDSGRMQVEEDLIFYGRETRPVHKAIAYTTSPFIPGLSGEEDRCLGFLVNLGIGLKANDRWRAIGDLSAEEKQKIFSEIAKHLSTHGFPNDVALSLIGTVYILTGEDRWTPLRDAREYASLLNACGRMSKNGLGVALGLGSRGATLDEAQTLFDAYKRTLSERLDWVTRTPRSVQRLRNINVIDGSGVIDELMISTVASILTSNNFFDDAKPVVAITTAENNTVKVSGRMPNGSKKGKLNLGEIFQEASTRLHGRGGGHDAAAGAQLPKGAESEFIRFVDQQVGTQDGK